LIGGISLLALVAHGQCVAASVVAPIWRANQFVADPDQMTPAAERFGILGIFDRAKCAFDTALSVSTAPRICLSIFVPSPTRY
jgi:hypothetical protein